MSKKPTIEVAANTGGEPEFKKVNNVSDLRDAIKEAQKPGPDYSKPSDDAIRLAQSISSCTDMAQLAAREMQLSMFIVDVSHVMAAGILGGKEKNPEAAHAFHDVLFLSNVYLTMLQDLTAYKH